MRFSRHCSIVGAFLALCFSFASGDAFGQSVIVNPSPDYWAKDILLDRTPESFGAFGSNLALFAKDTGLQIANPANGSTVLSLGSPTDYNGLAGVWTSFITADPSGNSLWVGFTKYSNGDDRIYQVDLSGNWTQRASLTGNFDMQFSGSKAFISANASGLGAGNAAIWELDTAAANSLTQVAYVGGYSAGLGADSGGNVYYGTYSTTPGAQSLFRFSAADIAGAVTSGTPLTLGNAEKLADFVGENGPSDIDVDAGDNVVFNLNSYDNPSQIAVWNGIAGNGANYDVIGSGSGLYHWYGILETSGNVRNIGGKVYTQDYYNLGIGQLQKVNHWTGGSTADSLWRTPENWSAGAAPQANDVLYFGGTVRLTPENDFPSGTIFGGINWQYGSDFITLTGNSLGLNGDVCNCGINGQTIDLPITLIGNNCAFDAFLGDIEIKKPLSEGVAGRGITKLGSEKLILSAHNTYTGPTDIQAGILVLTESGDISPDSAVSVVAGATLEISGGSHVLGTIDGQGSTVIDSGATLTVASIVQSSLIIGSSNAAAVPEPGTFVMLMAVTAGLIFVGRRHIRE